MPSIPLEVATARTSNVDGEVAWLDFGGPADAPLIVAVHGLGGAAWNWAAIAPELAKRFRVIAPDLAGHGATRSLGRGTTVRDNRRLLDRWLAEVAGEAPVTLLGNSMGGAISLLEAAIAPGRVSRLVLVDPALPRPVFSRIDPTVAAQFAVTAIPGVGLAAMRRRARRVGVKAQVMQTLKLCTVDVHRIPQWVIDLGIAYSEERQSDPASGPDFLAASRSVVKLLSRPGPMRRAARAVDAAGIPVLLIHGDRDRLIPLDAAQRFAAAHPRWRLEIAEDAGHIPMLEFPDWTVETISGWLAETSEAADQTAG